MSQYFPPYRSSKGDIKVALDLSNYATKTDFKNVTHVDVSSFASKTNLASLKTEVDKLDVDKLTLNLKLVIMLGFQGIKIFLLKGIHLTGVKRFFL